MNSRIILLIYWIPAEDLIDNICHRVSLGTLETSKQVISQLLSYNQLVRYGPQYAYSERGVADKASAMKEIEKLDKEYRQEQLNEVTRNPYSIELIAPESDLNVSDILIVIKHIDRRK